MEKKGTQAEASSTHPSALRLKYSRQVTVNPLDSNDLIRTASERLSAFIYEDCCQEFSQYCQINREDGPEIIKSTLEKITTNKAAMTWPVVFGDESSLPRFWGDSPPMDQRKRRLLILKPVRFVR